MHRCVPRPREFNRNVDLWQKNIKIQKIIFLVYYTFALMNFSLSSLSQKVFIAQYKDEEKSQILCDLQK